MRTLFTNDIRNYDPNWPSFERPSVRAVIVRDGKIALIHAARFNYYRFPGGGLLEGETNIQALCREVREETGLVVKTDTIREFGYVERSQKDDISASPRVFIQKNYYYFCDVEDYTVETSLEDYEKQERFELQWVEPAFAIEINRRRHHGSKDRFMIQREARILEILGYGLKQISPQIWYLPASDDPLSADVYLVYGNSACYVYDTGANETSCRLLSGINNKTAIISHFHADHSTNARKVNLDCLIDGKLDDPIVYDDNVHIEISNIVSSHCKDSLMMNVNNTWLLVGDALYPGIQNSRAAWNVQKISQTIDAIKNCNTQYVVRSHTDAILTKKEALDYLNEIKSKRLKNSPWIFED